MNHQLLWEYAQVYLLAGQFHLRNDDRWKTEKAQDQTVIISGLFDAYLVFGNTSVNRVCVGKVVSNSHLVGLVT